MTSRHTPAEPGTLDAQRQHWESTFANRAEMFGEAPSEPARQAAELFKQQGVTDLLELGAGQGRDTLLFAQEGFRVHAVDYSSSGLEAIRTKSGSSGLASAVSTTAHDIRTPLPFSDSAVDACFSHMLFCMALTSVELESLSAEVWRVLKPGGLNVYTVRHTEDAHYGAGVHRGEDLYEMGGFIVHFFTRRKWYGLHKGSRSWRSRSSRKGDCRASSSGSHKENAVSGQRELRNPSISGPRAVVRRSSRRTEPISRFVQRRRQ